MLGDIIMKKFGQLCLCAVPLLSVFLIENLVIFFFMGIAFLVELIYYKCIGTVDPWFIYEDIFNLLMETDFNTYIMVMYAIIAIAVFGIWYYAQYNGNYLPKVKTIFHPISIVGIIVLVPGAQYLTSYLVTIISAIFPSWLEAYEELMESAGMDDTLTFGLFLYSVILAPIAEELTCRGITLSQAKKVLPFWLANILQALLFGVLHMNMLQGTYAFCLGLILGFLFEKSGSLYPPILFHMLFNFFGTVLSEYMPYGDSDFAFIFWFLFGLAATIGGIALYITGTKQAKGNVSVSPNSVTF